MKITCKIDFISEEMIVGEAKRRKIYVIITEIGREPPASIVIDFLGMKADLLNKVQKGDIVEIEYSIQTINHKGRRINNIRGHSINSLMEVDG